MKEVIKNNKGKVSTGVILLALIANFGTISNELQEWFGVAANPDRTEFKKNWKKPKNELPDYISYSERTSFGIKAMSAK